MPIRINPLAMQDILACAFSRSAFDAITYYTGLHAGAKRFSLHNGEQPVSPASTLDDNRALTTIGSSANEFPTNIFTSPSRGITMLSGPAPITIRATGVPTDKLATFFRVYCGSGSNIGLMDVPVALTQGPENCVLTKLDGFVANEVLAVTDLRMRVRTEGSFCFNYALANQLLRLLTRSNPGQYGLYGAVLFGWGGCPNAQYATDQAGTTTSMSSTGYPTVESMGKVADLIVTLHSGPVPANCNVDPGPVVWTNQVSNDASNNTGVNIFEVSGSTVSTNRGFTSVCSAAGEITHMRIVKSEKIWTDPTDSLLYNYPRLAMQAAVGTAPGMVTVSDSLAEVGKSITLNEFSMVFDPNF